MGLLDWFFRSLLSGCCRSSAKSCHAFLNGVKEVANVLRYLREGMDEATAITKAAEELGMSVAKLTELYSDPTLRSEAEDWQRQAAIAQAQALVRQRALQQQEDERRERQQHADRERRRSIEQQPSTGRCQ